jgi:hypothetical protein
VKTQLFNVRLGSQDRQILADIAQRDGITLSDAARKLIRAGQKTERTPADRRQDGALVVSGP